MKNEGYKHCLDFNYGMKAWLDKINSNINNPENLVLHPMTRCEPICRRDCPYANKCRELWKGKYGKIHIQTKSPIRLVSQKPT